MTHFAILANTARPDIRRRGMGAWLRRGTLMGVGAGGVGDLTGRSDPRVARGSGALSTPT